MKMDVVFVFLKLTSVFPVYICALISFFFFFFLRSALISLYL